jgi:diacylglycerol kinase family enzyme
VSGVGVITNPRARRNRRNPRIDQGLAYVLGEKGELRKPSDLDALDAVATEFHGRGIDVLCINGGDGTLHKVLTAMVRVYGSDPLPKVALLRGGAMNTIANSVGVRGSGADILQYVVTAFHADRPLPTTRRWLMCVDGDQYGFLFGNGLFARYLEAYYKKPDPSPLTAALVLLRATGSAIVGGAFAKWMTAPVPATVDVDGVRWPRADYRVVAAGTIAQVGLGFKPFAAAPRHPGHIAALGLGCRMRAIPGLLPAFWRGHGVNHPEVDMGVFKKIVIRSEDGRSGFMLDGDLYEGSQALTLEVGPHVDFVVPDW